MGQVEKGNFPQIWEREEGSGLGKGDKENLYFPLVWPGLPSDLTLEANTTRMERGEVGGGGVSIWLIPGGNFKAHPPVQDVHLKKPEQKPRTQEKNGEENRGPLRD